jgi:hypothetical protein
MAIPKNIVSGADLSEGKNSVEMVINLPLKYYREKDRLFYIISSV